MTLRTRKPGVRNSAHSIRVPDDVWERARRRADYERTTISHVLATFAEGYADGRVNMPKQVFMENSEVA